MTRGGVMMRVDRRKSCSFAAFLGGNKKVTKKKCECGF